MNDPESGLVELAKGGDDGAFEQLVRLNQASIRRLAAAMLNDAVEAEDAAQEAFVKAYRKLSGFRGQSRFSSWLYRITINHCKNVIAKRDRWHWLSLESMREEGIEPPVALNTPEKSARGTEAGETLSKILAGLPDNYRAILLLREMKGLSYLEISKELVISVDGVKSRLRRAHAAAVEKLRHIQQRTSVK